MLPRLMQAPAEQLVIRAARRADLQNLTLVWRELMELHQAQDPHFELAADAVERWQQLANDVLNRADGFLLVATVDGRAVGFCLGWIARNPPIYATEEVGFISEIAVARAMQRRGIGMRLVEAATAWLGERSVHSVQLSTAAWNTSAQAFWQALGGEPLLIRYSLPVNSHRRSS